MDATYRTHEARKSQSGCTLRIRAGSGDFLSQSKKQTVAADSTTGAETHLAAKVFMWARTLPGDMGYFQLDPTALSEVKIFTIAMINNDSYITRLSISRFAST